jgi:hypothetical protein
MSYLLRTTADDRQIQTELGGYNQNENRESAVRISSGDCSLRHEVTGKFFGELGRESLCVKQSL